MSALLPVMVYGLEIPSGDIITPAVPSFPATFRITMAALDPSAPPRIDASTNGEVPLRATLKIVRQPVSEDEDSEDDSEDEDYFNALLGGADSEEDDEDNSSDEEKNGGPSDPSKSKKARKEKAVADLKKALEEEEDEDEDMDVDDSLTNGMNGILSKIKKGKAKATGEEDEESDVDEDDLDVEEFVLCTLDPSKNYQQPLDITIGEDERVFFKVSGTHTIYLTGNYVIPSENRQMDDEDDYDSEEDEDYDLSPDEDVIDEDDESDILDDLEDPRITEVSTDEETAPKPANAKGRKEKAKVDPKGKNKRAAEESEDEPASLDNIMAKALKPAEATKGEPKLSKKQQKKLKNNAGEAVAASSVKKKDEKPAAESPANGKGDKKVQFAKDLEQGPTPTGTPKTSDAKAKSEKSKAALGVKVVQGVTIDDKKLGTGPAAKKGDKVQMRYIGKLESGVQFDANKSGPPFSFKLGAGEVIKGWDIGIAGMSVGGERRITIPSNLGYGSKKTGAIPANSTLKFDVKLLAIK